MPESGAELLGKGAVTKAGEAIGCLVTPDHGMSQAQSEAQAMDLPHFLAETAERGKGVLVNQILLGMTSGQRIDMLRQMDLINEMHRKTNHNLPDLVIDYNKQGFSVALDYPGTKDDMVIVSAKVDKYDEVTNVTCNTAKNLPITHGHGCFEPFPGPQNNSDPSPPHSGGDNTLPQKQGQGQDQRQGQDQQPQKKVRPNIYT